MLVSGSTDLRGSNSTFERHDRHSSFHASSRSVGVASWFRLCQAAPFRRARHRHTDTRRGGALDRVKDATVSLADRQGVRQLGWLIPPWSATSTRYKSIARCPLHALLTATLPESRTSWRPLLPPRHHAQSRTSRCGTVGEGAAPPSLLPAGPPPPPGRCTALVSGGGGGGEGACGRGVVQGGGAREERRHSPPRVCGSRGSAGAHRGGGRRGGCPPVSRRALLLAAVAVVGRGGTEVG